MPEQFDTAMGLLSEAADLLEAQAEVHENGTDPEEFLSLSGRIRTYLSTCRPTTPIGMPRLTSPVNQLSSESVLARVQGSPHQHVRIVP